MRVLYGKFLRVTTSETGKSKLTRVFTLYNAIAPHMTHPMRAWKIKLHRDVLRPIINQVHNPVSPLTSWRWRQPHSLPFYIWSLVPTYILCTPPSNEIPISNGRILQLGQVNHLNGTPPHPSFLFLLSFLKQFYTGPATNSRNHSIGCLFVRQQSTTFYQECN